MRRLILPAILPLFMLLTEAVAASSDDKVRTLLKEPTAPPGVVFEIVSGKAETLRWAIPTVSHYADQLRARFPDLSIAVVSHGDEQFALLEERENAFKDVHNAVRTLKQDKGIEVQVCGTYAGMKNFTPEEFPAYVDVAASGPATINDYRALGFVHILVTQPRTSR